MIAAERAPTGTRVPAWYERRLIQTGQLPVDQPFFIPSPGYPGDSRVRGRRSLLVSQNIPGDDRARERMSLLARL